jgi:hypothetical protein
MIRITAHGHAVRLNGAPAEMMLFYVFWQSTLWPAWMQYEKFGEANDGPTEHRKKAIETINQGELLLHNCGEMFGAAVKTAASRCEQLGIAVSSG